MQAAMALSSRRSGFSWLRLLILAICLLTPALAQADPAAQARFHDELARGHYEAGRFESALREFFLEQRVSPNPRIAFNIALCFQELERNDEGFQYFNEYLTSQDDDSERRAYAERVVESLKPQLALVSIRSAPAGADIYIDRKELGSYGVTPKVIAMTPGKHQVWVEREGYRTATGDVVAERGQELELELAPERIVGQLTVTSPVTGRAEVRGPSGDTLGKGPLPLKLTLPPASYEISVQSPGHLPWTSMARVEADGAARVTAVPLPAPAVTGDITVTSNVPGALIEVNGEAAGFSPTVLPKVAVGTHRIRVQAPNLLPWSGDVKVAPEERSWLTVSLEEPPTEHHSPAVWVAGGIGAAALVTSGILGLLALETHNEYQNADDLEKKAISDRGLALNTAADIALVSAAVATATAIVLYFTTKEVRGKPSAASIALSKR